MKLLGALRSGVSSVWGWLDLDQLDLLLILGLWMLWRGLALISEAWAWAACGSVLIVFVLIGAFRRGKSSGE